MYLTVNKPVYVLQFDVETDGDVFSTVIADTYVSYFENTPGVFTVVVFAINDIMFSGKCVSVNGSIGSISNVSASDQDSNLIDGVSVEPYAIEPSCLLKYKIA